MYIYTTFISRLYNESSRIRDILFLNNFYAKKIINIHNKKNNTRITFVIKKKNVFNLSVENVTRVLRFS